MEFISNKIIIYHNKWVGTYYNIICFFCFVTYYVHFLTLHTLTSPGSGTKIYNKLKISSRFDKLKRGILLFCRTYCTTKN